MCYRYNDSFFQAHLRTQTHTESNIRPAPNKALVCSCLIHSTPQSYKLYTEWGGISRLICDFIALNTHAVKLKQTKEIPNEVNRASVDSATV